MALINLRMVCYQDSQGVGRLETFRFGPAKQPEVHQTPMAYVMSEVKLLDTNWNEIIRKCRRILSGLVSWRSTNFFSKITGPKSC